MVSVLLATRNRAALLARVLEGLRSLAEPTGGWELVVVDNGSTDGTRETLDGFLGLLPLTVVSQPAPGKNLALNIGLDAVGGDLVVLTDDDVFPHAEWLVEMRRTADANPDFGVFGGPLVPRWEIEPPRWVLDWVPAGPVYSLTDPDLPEGPIEPHLVFGGNMAVRAEAFASGTRFDPGIGPASGRYAMGSETELVRRLSEGGMRCFFQPRAVVEHFVRREQLDRGWVLGRATRFGAGQYRHVMRDVPVPGDLVAGVPRWLLLAYLRRTRDVVRASVVGRGEPLFRAAWERAFLRGQIAEARRMARESAATGATT